jgi:hypothetical protein
MDEALVIETINGISLALFGVIVTIVALVPGLLEYVKANSPSPLEASISLDRIRIYLKRLALILPILLIITLLLLFLLIIDSQFVLYIEVIMTSLVVIISTYIIFKLASEIRNLL